MRVSEFLTIYRMIKKEARAKWCKKKMKRFKLGLSNLVYNIVNGDESLIYAYEHKKKKSIVCLEVANYSRAHKNCSFLQCLKKMIVPFVSKTNHVATMALKDRRTINGDWYIFIECKF